MKALNDGYAMYAKRIIKDISSFPGQIFKAMFQ